MTQDDVTNADLQLAGMAVVRERIEDAAGLLAILTYYAITCSAEAVIEVVTGREQRLLRQIRPTRQRLKADDARALAALKDVEEAVVEFTCVPITPHPPPRPCEGWPNCDCGDPDTVLAACDPEVLRRLDGDWCREPGEDWTPSYRRETDDHR